MTNKHFEKAWEERIKTISEGDFYYHNQSDFFAGISFYKDYLVKWLYSQVDPLPCTCCNGEALVDLDNQGYEELCPKCHVQFDSLAYTILEDDIFDD